MVCKRALGFVLAQVLALSACDNHTESATVHGKADPLEFPTLEGEEDKPLKAVLQCVEGETKLYVKDSLKAAVNEEILADSSPATALFYL